MNPLFSEHRLLRLTLDEINAQRKKAGASTVSSVSPIGTSQRSADANFTVANAPKGQNALAVTDPSGTAALRFQETQKYIKDNPEAFRSVQSQNVVDPVTGEVSTTGKVVDTSADILRQASEGAAMAGGYTLSPEEKARAAGNAENLAGAKEFQASEANLSPKAGAMGQAGALGFNPKGSLVTLDTLKQKAAEYSAPSVTIDPETAAYLTTEQKQAIQDRYTASKLTAEANLKAFQEKMTKDQQAREATQQSSAGDKPTTTTTVKPPDFTMTDTGIKQISAMITADPTLAATYVPQMMDLMARRTKLENDFNAEVSAFESQDKNKDGVSDGVQSQVASSQAALISRTAKADAINEENKSINLAAAELAKDMGQIAQKKFQLDQHRNEQLQVQNNIEMERKNRLIANKLGVSAGGNGMKWMSEEIQKGIDNLTYLREAGSLQEANFALQIGQQYALNVRQATNGYDAQKLQIDSDFSANIANLNGIVTLDAKERREERKKISKDYLEALDKNDEKHATMLKEFNQEVSKRISDKEKDKTKNAMSTKDKLGFTSSLRSGINQNKVITQAKDVDGFYGSLNAGFNEYVSLIKQIESGEISATSVSLNPSQTAVIGSLARILDPGSVVRNEEYERQVFGQGASSIIPGLVQKLKSGGTGLTTKEVTAMKTLADKLHDSWEEKLSKEMQPFILDIQDWNASYPDAQIDYAQVIPVDRVHLPSQTFSTWESQASGTYDTSGTENVSGSAGWLSPEKAPANGYRTDRHNNPTAFTVDVARQAGLVEGVDYEVDTALQNGFPTAKLIGDPFEKTIKVIDKIGFYKNGKEGSTDQKDWRWQHTVIPKMEWQSMNNEQKKSFVVSMYQKEGGTGVLAQGVSLPEGSTERRTYSLVPSAQAESPDDTITFTDEPEPSPLISGSAISVKGTGANPTLAYKVVGRFRNKKTGEEISVASANDIAFYKERPSAYEDLEAPKTKTTTKPLSLGGKPLPS